MTKLTIGCDPEFFAYDTERRMVVSAHDLVPGTKDNPSPLPNGGAVQADGVAIEFNIPPASTGKEFADSISSALNDIRAIVPQKYAFVARAAVFFDPEYFKTLPDKVKELGCNPDYDCTGKLKPTPTLSKDKECMRTGSGHIHFGWTKDEDVTDPNYIADCATFSTVLGGSLAYTLAAFSDYNVNTYSDYYRSTLYGSNGAFRPKPYGMEYRGPSNQWLNASPTYWARLYQYCTAVFKCAVDGAHINTASSLYYNDTHTLNPMFLQKLPLSNMYSPMDTKYNEKYVNNFADYLAKEVA